MRGAGLLMMITGANVITCMFALGAIDAIWRTHDPEVFLGLISLASWFVAVVGGVLFVAGHVRRRRKMVWTYEEPFK